jgi:hypothetical protein
VFKVSGGYRRVLRGLWSSAATGRLRYLPALKTNLAFGLRRTEPAGDDAGREYASHQPLHRYISLFDAADENGFYPLPPGVVIKLPVGGDASTAEKSDKHHLMRSSLAIYRYPLQVPEDVAAWWIMYCVKLQSLKKLRLR